VSSDAAAPKPPAVRAWERTLDEFELRLDLQEAALARGSTDPIPPFRPPVTLPMLPDTMLERANRLMQRSWALAETLEAAHGDAQRQLDDLGAARAGGPTRPAEPVFFDSRV